MESSSRFRWFAGYRGAKRQMPAAGTQKAKINSIFAPKAVEPVAVATPQVWPSVEVIFEIDQLGTTLQERMFYGLQARHIFMKYINPVTDSPAFL
jgi:hypothetical protein